MDDADARAEVLARHPRAVAEYADLSDIGINRAGWFVLRDAGFRAVGWPYMIGSGRTEEQAWAHALSLITAADHAMCG